MMTKHRIGRVELPWANLEPPIRLPDYYINLEKRKAKKEAAIGLGHTDNEKSRRGRSVDLGTVGLSHILSLSHKACCMLPIRTQLTHITRPPSLLARN
jgi:delta8-fatty-acid desaturase